MSAWLARLQPLLERYRQLQPRERVLVVVGTSAVLLTLVYLLIWEPLVQAHAARQQALVNARTVAQQLEQAAVLAQGQRRSGGASRSLSVLAAVDQSLKQAAVGKAPSRLQPEGEREVRVWFEGVSFDALLPWLADLQTRHGVQLTSAEIERQASAGLVDARLTLSRP
ncbi:MAG TPA: type II secretion system protein M [Nevskiaceae bacterium]|nr:type II secretion system protein M [Nevskiaceae bacterium]